ncbi:MAG: hypothetical protein M3305_05780 [Actinomycetota bacterium]|nr:hypothetical protein [Actinomycetota bacterium]
MQSEEETATAGGDVAEDRIDSLEGFRESILDLVKKLGDEFEELQQARERDDLLLLYMQTVWSAMGIAENLEDEGAPQAAATEEERRAMQRAWRALLRLDDLAEDIEEAIDALEEIPATVVHIAELRRRRKAG